jgi:hypothetical protein
MSMVIERKTGYQVIRLTSESVSETETNRIIDGVRCALSEGIRCHAISIEVALCSNIMMMGLLVVCERMVRRFGGHIGLVMLPECNEAGLRSLSESLNITVYNNEEEFRVSSGAVAAKHQEETRTMHTVDPYFMGPLTEYSMHLLPM